MELKRIKFSPVLSLLVPLLLFWAVLSLRIPYSITFHFHSQSAGLFAVLLLLYYFALRLPGNRGVLVGLGLTMLLFALALSYIWTSGFSDNFISGGLLPYKDAKNYYLGANLILNGLPVEKAGQAVERPLFPGFLASLLTLTDQNLKISLALLGQLAGLGVYLAARQIGRSLGNLPASLYITLMCFYIKPFLGYTLSEPLGFTFGCFAFVLILHSSHGMKRFDLLLGSITLLAAVSARAGAFIIFPMLVLWIGWICRGEKRFSMKAAAYAFIVVLAGYFLVNTIYARLLGIPPGSAFGNFSYALYGQVRGGTGWHSAIEELGTRDPVRVYRAALQFFLAHPISLFIGAAKSYRDFFLLGAGSTFEFRVDGWRDALNLSMWIGMMVLLVRGLIRLLKAIRWNPASLLLAGFAGVILSIPFLPPIDGGTRFYASTMPFFLAIPAAGLGPLANGLRQDPAATGWLDRDLLVARSIAVILTALTLLMPIGVHALGHEPAYDVPACPAPQKPFAAQVQPGSYIDLLKDGTTPCGPVPGICLSDFERNNTEKKTDDFYQELLSLTESNATNVRIIPAIDLITHEFLYFYISHSRIQGGSSTGLMTGCALEIKTEHQSIYEIESAALDEH